MKFILASKSPRRAELLRHIGMVFESVPSGIDEGAVEKTRPTAYVRKLAMLKAKAVAKGRKECVVIAADTVVVIGGQVFGKPKSREEAFAMLRFLSGRVHQVVTGVCVINKYSAKTATKTVTTRVKFKDLSNDLIRWYVGTGEPMGKAGSYAIQDKGALLVEWIRGDYYNVVGLPLVTLSSMLESTGAKLAQ